MSTVEEREGLEEVRRVAADGAVWGLPRVLFDLVARAHPETGRFFRLPADAGVLAPGLGETHGDLCVSSAILDLSRGPTLISLPEAHGAYLTLVLHDSWGRILAAFGSRRTGADRSTVLVAGADWIGEPPGEASLVQAPGNRVWAVCRILGAGEGGREDALRLQQAIGLAGPDTPRAGAGAADVLAPSTPFEAAFEALTPQRFVERLAGLLPARPSDLDDAAMMAALRRIGVGGPEPVGLAAWPRERVRALHDGAADGLRGVRRRVCEVWKLGRAASWTRVGGRAARGPLDRAAAALASLGAPPPEELLVFTAAADADGQPLSAERAYSLVFGAGEAPPANAFWSVCVTDPSGAPLQAPFTRLSVGDWFGLPPGVAEPFEVCIQAGEGAGARRPLQPPPGPFGLRLELYGPRRSALDGAWRPPELIDHGPRADSLVSFAAARSATAASASSRLRRGADAGVVHFLPKGASP